MAKIQHPIPQLLFLGFEYRINSNDGDYEYYFNIGDGTAEIWFNPENGRVVYCHRFDTLLERSTPASPIRRSINTIVADAVAVVENYRARHNTIAS